MGEPQTQEAHRHRRRKRGGIRVRQKRLRRLKRLQAQQQAQVAAGPELQVEPQTGGKGAVLERIFDDHPRSTAMTVNRLLQIGGVFKDDEVETLLRGGGTLAAKAVANNQPRDYRAAMSVLLTVAKMQQDAEKNARDADRPGAQVQVNVAAGDAAAVGVQVYVPDNGRERPYEEDEDDDDHRAA
jgi:hypothetical protein